MNKELVAIGFLLFAVFFGAGNLIFPPQLGAQSGEHFLPATLGFLLTGVGLPLLGVIAAAATPGGPQNAANKVHPIFSLIFITLVFLAIGPFFAIPRTGATAYEMAIVPFVGSGKSLFLLLWTLLYFGLSCWMSLNPSKLVDRIGQMLTPALLVALTILGVKVASVYMGNAPLAPIEAYQSNALGTGFTEGYLTLDAFSAFALIGVITANVRSSNPGIGSGELLKKTAMAGLIAAAGLVAVYGTLGWIGSHAGIGPAEMASVAEEKRHLGSFIMVEAAKDAFGTAGGVLLGVIVTLACLTTSVGMTVAVAQYLTGLLPKISYEKLVMGISVFSLVVANQGLSALISVSLPVLLVLYPIIIAMVALMMLARWVKTPRLSWQLGIGLTGVVSLLATLNAQELMALPFMTRLPLASSSLEWLPFMLLGVALGWAFGSKGEMVDFSPSGEEGRAAEEQLLAESQN